LVIGLPCWLVLAVAAWVHPDSRGYNTHTQLGLSPCAMPAVTGMPCPTCGMTTAFAHMARGHVIAAVQTQAFGAALFVATAAAAIVATMQAVFAADLLGRARARVRIWWLYAVLAAFFAAWVLKIVMGSPH
jgi:hypothetical protein